MNFTQPKCALILVFIFLKTIQSSPPDFARDWHISLNENFNNDTLPTGWTVTDGNNNGTSWTIDTINRYAEYSDTGLASGEDLISPALAIPIGAESLKMEYNYFFYITIPPERYISGMRKFSGGSWSAWIDLRVYLSDTGGRDSIDLTSFMPLDSIQFDWSYENLWGSYGTLCIVDSVIVKYFDANSLSEKNERKSNRQTFFITPSILKAGTTISFTISQPTAGSLDLFDTAGRKITTICHGKFSVGRHSYKIEKDLPSGVYFIFLDTDVTKTHRKLVVE